MSNPPKLSAVVAFLANAGINFSVSVVLLGDRTTRYRTGEGEPAAYVDADCNARTLSLQHNWPALDTENGRAELFCVLD